MICKRVCKGWQSRINETLRKYVTGSEESQEAEQGSVEDTDKR